MEVIIAILLGVLAYLVTKMIAFRVKSLNPIAEDLAVIVGVVVCLIKLGVVK